MTERAQKVKEAFWENTEYPDDLDEWNLANAIRAIVNEHQYYQCCEEVGVEDMVVDARLLYELADELEAL